MGTVPLPPTDPCKCREFCQFWLGLRKKKTDTKQSDALHGKHLCHWVTSRCDNCYRGPCCHQLDAIDTQRNCFPCLHIVSPYTEGMAEAEVTFFCHGCWSKFANWWIHIWDQRKSTLDSVSSAGHDSEGNASSFISNIRVPPSIYKGGNRRNDSVHTENAESGNIKNINEKLWKPVPYWMCCPGLLLVQRVGNNLVLGWHI